MCCVTKLQKLLCIDIIVVNIIIVINQKATERNSFIQTFCSVSILSEEEVSKATARVVGYPQSKATARVVGYPQSEEAEEVETTLGFYRHKKHSYLYLVAVYRTASFNAMNSKRSCYRFVLPSRTPSPLECDVLYGRPPSEKGR